MIIFLFLAIHCGTFLHFCSMGKILISLFLMFGIYMQAEVRKNDSILAMFWNLENFFDYSDSGEGESDKEFSSFGSRHWTKKRFYAKCNAVAKTIYRISDDYGALPDIIGLAEIENAFVLRRVLQVTSLKKTDYGIIHFDGRDRRGIDVAFLYRKSRMTPVSITRKIPVHQGDTLMTRDILHVRMSLSGGSEMDFIVNHHPSRYGGTGQSEGRRMAAMETLRQLCDSLLADSPSEGIVAMGDFNDTPDSSPMDIIREILVNKAEELHRKGSGTIRYEGKWELIDMFLVSPELDSRTNMEIVRIPFLMTEDKKHAGYKPFRTYSGPRYNGGVSDHCPVLLTVN